MTENINKKEEKLWGCWFAFNKNSNLFSIEINDIIYIMTSKEFNEIVCVINTFYGGIINSKVVEAISNFVQQDTAPKIENELHGDSSTSVIVAEDAKAAVSLWESLLHGKKKETNGKPGI